MNEQPLHDQVFDLASILNILWRRRVIVLALPLLGLLTGALYGIFGTRRWEAYATIRPGITAFDPSGGPVRQWQLKDIQRWYEQELYRKGLIEKLHLDRDARPVIRAEFIAQGLTNLSGGEVITLWTTATSPELAAAILDTSLVLFNAYAEADSVSSQLKLTRDGLIIRTRELENQLLGVEKKEAGLQLRLEAARAESTMIEGKIRELGVDLSALQRREAYCRGRVEDLASRRPALVADLATLDRTIERVAAGAVLDTTTIPGWVRRDAVLDGGDILEGLTGAKLEVSQALAANQALSDSLLYEADTAALKADKLKIQQDASIQAQLRDVERKLGDLRLERRLDIPSQRRDLELQAAAVQSKLSLLSPLQRVGQTVVSDKPVRPRTLRAILILVALGLIGGTVLAFSVDYLMTHRQRIFRA